MAGGGGISARNKAKTIWQLTVSCGKGPDGKPIQVRETFYGSKLDAKARLAGLVSEVNRRSYLLSGDPTFTDFAAEFMKNYAATNLQPRTIDAYTDRLRRLFPAFGHLKLSRISPSKIAAFYAALAKEVSPDYVHKHHQALHAILEKAVQWEKLESNPTRKVDTPPLPDIEAFSLNADQLDALVEAVVTSEPLQTQAIVLIPLETTAGAGELMGLEWSMVNFDTNEIEICQSAQTQKGKGLVVKRVKNKYRWRIVKVQPWVMAILRKYKVEQQAMRLEMGNLWTVDFDDDRPGGGYCERKSGCWARISENYPQNIRPLVSPNR